MNENINYRLETDTDEPPINQKEIVSLIQSGYSVDLMAQFVRVNSDSGHYCLYIRYRSHIRPIYTQRMAHRSFVDPKRAIEWGKRLGFKSFYLSIDLTAYPEV